jgi:hypothetical protein
MELMRAAKATGMTEPEIDAAMRQLREYAISAAFFELWSGGALRLRWRHDTMGLAFVAMGPE